MRIGRPFFAVAVVSALPKHSADQLAFIAAQDNGMRAASKRGTPEYSGCRQTIDRRRDQVRRDKVAGALAEGLEKYGRRLSRAAAAAACRYLERSKPPICKPTLGSWGTARCEQGY
jgi:hypothetical protein